MEINTTNTASLSANTVTKLHSLLQQLETSAFKAIISNKLGNQSFSINTKAGTLHILTDLPVKVGDELTLQLKKDQSTLQDLLTILKINRPTSQTLQATISAPLNKNLAPTFVLNNPAIIKKIPQEQTHFVAKIVSQDKASINLQNLKGEPFTLSKTDFKHTGLNLQQGEYIAIKRLPEKSIEIQLINKEQLLHQAQRQLLPKQQPLLQTHQQLSKAAFKLFESINLEAKQLVQQTKTNGGVQNKNPLTASALNNKDSIEALIKVLKDNPTLANNKKININPETLQTFKKIKQELSHLLTSNRIGFKYLAAETIHKLLSSLNSLSQTQSPVADNQSFTQKLSLINQSILKLLHDINVHSSETKQSSKEEEVFLEALKTSLKEARQSVESTLNKVLFQNTSSKLNQEINNTFLINTQIPFEIDKETKDVNLHIKQHKKESEEQDDIWEIQLSLEMGALGLISTKIMLKDHIDVSVKFWAELVNTKQLLEDKKTIFKQQMTNAGFTLTDFNIYLGKKTEDVIPMNISNKRFIDINV